MRKIVLSILTTLLLGFGLSAQNVRVSGTVTDGEGRQMAGVTVMVQGTQTGVVTGADGKYAINAPTAGVLEFAHLGMVTQLVPVSGRTTINITMSPDNTVIDDVVVLAFGEVKKKDLTGSVTTLSASDLSKKNIGTVTKALEGEVAGVNITSSTGQPGQDANVYIRGLGSISASASALFVVDGVPYGYSLSALNPNDIETMTVSKDAAANALYGARAANGVVFVTTKKGKAGAARINFEAKLGANSIGVRDTPTIQDAGVYYELTWAGIYNYGRAMGYDDAGARGLAQGNYHSMLGNYNNYKVPTGEGIIDPTTGKINKNAEFLYSDNYDDHIYRTALRQEYSLNISGGNEKNDYYVSFGYLDDPSYIIQSSMQRFSARSQFNSQVKDWLKVGMNMSYTQRRRNAPDGFSGAGANTGNLFLWTQWQNPLTPYYARDEEGNIRYNDDGSMMYENGMGSTLSPFGTTSDVFNSMALGHPVEVFEKDIYETINDYFSGKAYAEATFLKDFKFTFNISADNATTNSTEFSNNEIGTAATPTYNGWVYKMSGRDFVFNTQQLLSWDRDFGRHSVSALAGHEFYHRTDYQMSVDKSHIFMTGIPELSNAVVSEGAGGLSQTVRKATEGYFARATYSYDNRYVFTTSFRRDGSSAFKYNIWGNFWSVGGAWHINNEKFMKNANFVDNLKLRVSYGTSGNENLTRSYSYTDLWEVSESDGLPSIAKTDIGNPGLTWEKNNQLDLGLDFTLFDRLSGSIDYFNRRTENMVWARPVAPSTGVSSRMENVGVLGNSGIEVELGVDIIKTKDIYWRFSTNGMFLSNKLVEIPDVYEDPYDAAYYLRGVGKPYYNFNVYKYAGVDPDNGNPLFWKDDNGTMVKVADREEATKFELGSALPDWYGGFGTTFRYKFFDLTVQFAYQIGGLKYDSNSLNLADLGRPGFAVGEYEALNYWTPERTDTDVPKPVFNGSDLSIDFYCDRFLRDASYINLKTLNVGFTLPEKWISKIGLSSVRIFMNADNLWFKSSFPGFDPRSGITGQNFLNYPQMKNISGGISISF